MEHRTGEKKVLQKLSPWFLGQFASIVRSDPIMILTRCAILRRSLRKNG